jgi:guanylate kinase
MTITKIQSKVIIFCAPSGAGKTTITKGVMAKLPTLAFSVSATTRPKRDTEVEGKDYYFLSVDEFKHKKDNNEFLESEEVYPGRFYGTLKSEIERLTKEDKVIVFDVDVKGAMNLKKYFGDNALMVFIYVPIEELKKRLIARGTETPETLQTRLESAKTEMQFEDKADVIIPNIDLDKAINDAYRMVFDFLQTSS